VPARAGDPDCPYVSRGGLKLHHALDAFSINPSGLACADLGANVGGFTDCLLQRGATRVYAVDTGYGVLAWKLRNDPRVVVMERTNALHAEAPRGEGEGTDVRLVAVDLAWTPQRHAIPAALRWLGETGGIVSLIKPHYEVKRDEKALLRKGVLEEGEARRIAERTAAEMGSMGVRVLGFVESPIAGGAGKGNARGNREWLAHCVRA
jgi:23S rRNA (cytidine1920-2'-O)/16S rRNA (cytidine1409-2'-O)-methyltransferase